MRLLLCFFIAVLPLAAQIGNNGTPRSLADTLRDMMDSHGPAATQLKIEELVAMTPPIAQPPDEAKLNQLGYHYLGSGNLPAALVILKANVDFFPNSANVYDSYAEALMKKGDRDGAIANYEKSFQLDPKNRNAEAYLNELKARPDSLVNIQERMRFEDRLNDAFRAHGKGEPVPIASLRAEIRALVARNPVDAVGSLVNNFLYLSEAIDLNGAVDDWAYFAKSSNEQIRSLGEGKRGLAEALKAPLELKFTAIDGSEVDLSKLRGKVVLVDFWATWCGPCIQEIPNIVATYGKYHEKGFEIVGISFDQAPDPAKPHRRQKSAEQVAAFAKEKNMPWPQFYDGLYWNNTFGKQFGIRAIPAMFLIDRNGMIVSTNARGPKLEAEVKRLLGP